MSEAKEAPATPAIVNEPDQPGSTALARPAPAAARALTMATALQGLVPSSIGEAVMLCDALARSTAIPKSLRGNAASILTVVMTGVEIGLTPLQAVNNIFNIGGNLGMKGNLQLALVRNSGLMVHYDEGYDTSAEDQEDWFGWCDIGRKGDVAVGRVTIDGRSYAPGEQIIRRKTFSVRQAMGVNVISYDDEGSGDTRGGQGRGERRVMKLAEKENYRSWPDRMYPMRARTWVLEQFFGDVLKGIPSIEGMMDGQIIEGEIVNRTGSDDGADAILADIRDGDPESATAIEAGFDALKYSAARRLQKLTEFKGRGKDLAVWLRDEWGRVQGTGDVGSRRRAAAGAAKLEQANPPAPEPEPTPVPKDDIDEAMPTLVDTEPAQTETVPAPAETNQAGPEPAAGKAGQAAARAKAAFKSGQKF